MVDNNIETVSNKDDTINKISDNKILNDVGDGVASGFIEGGLEIVGRYSIKVICKVVDGIFDGI